MRPLAEQTVLVTGATDGLGRAVATELARGGATVLVHGRNEERGQATIAEIRNGGGGGSLRWYRADLSSLTDGVRATVRLIADPDLDGVTGRYYDGESVARAHPQAYDVEARRRLRELSERLTAR